MIKIAYIIDTIESPTAGTEKQLLLLLENLDRQQIRPYLCVLQGSEWLKNEFDLCPVYNLRIKSFKDPVSYRRIWNYAKFLKREKIDIVQTHFRDAGIAGILAARMAGVRVISTRRNQGYWLTRRELLIQKVLNRWVTVFIANSHSTKKWANEVEGIPEDKIRVIYNGIDPGPYLKLSPETREKYRRILEIPGNSPAIGIVANLRPVKGIEVFLRAAQLVKKQIPEARFVIVGDGVEKDNLERFADESGLNEGVTFLGKREDVVQILSALDVGVLSSHSESFSNSLIEYLAAGLPAVCTDVGGCREIIEHGVNGFVVSAGDYRAMSDYIIKIIREGMFDEMRTRNNKKAETGFSMNQTISMYEEIYSNITGPGYGKL